MSINILTKNDIPKLQKIKEELNIFRVIHIEIKPNLSMIEFFGEKGILRSFAENKKSAFKKAKKAFVNFKEEN